ncbi:MAG TPA: hypothetical protein VLB68_25495 [Pyrinomonadaceae bacterium]|nr:hypothetical protein [Pyrinomonadaceae bacterium]
MVHQTNNHTADLTTIVEGIARDGGTPLVVAENHSALGVIQLKAIIKGGTVERSDQMRQRSIRTVMITGDNPLTARRLSRVKPVSTTFSLKQLQQTRWLL